MNPTIQAEAGFQSGEWSTRSLAELVSQELGVQLHPAYGEGLMDLLAAYDDAQWLYVDLTAGGTQQRVVKGRSVPSHLGRNENLSAVVLELDSTRTLPDAVGLDVRLGLIGRDDGQDPAVGSARRQRMLEALRPKISQLIRQQLRPVVPSVGPGIGGIRSATIDYGAGEASGWQLYLSFLMQLSESA